MILKLLWNWDPDFNIICRIKNEMPGFTVQSLKKNPSLIPLHVCVVAGFVIMISFSTRVLTVSPDVYWRNNADRTPYERYRDKNYHLVDVYKIWTPCQAPIYRKPGESFD